MFDDPYAAAFVAAYGETDPPPPTAATPASTPQRRALAFHVLIRTRYFDDCLLSAAEAGCRQVVLLAAGLDTRAFRLGWPQGTRLFELDLPDLLEVKERVLVDVGASAACERVVVPADLTGDWLPTLAAHGFDPHAATAWLVEGVLVYLTPADAERVLATLTAGSGSESRLAFERGSGTRAVTADDTAAVTALWQGGATDPVGWLTAHGWDVTVDELSDVAAGYGRPTSRPTDSGFVRCVRS